MSDLRLSNLGATRNSSYSNVSIHDEDELNRMGDDYPRPPPDSELGVFNNTKEKDGRPGCCFVFSVFGIIFMTVIGLIFDSETVYIKDPGLENDVTMKQAAGNCFGAAGCYVVTAAISAFYYYKQEREAATTVRRVEYYRQFDD
ncbi:hypothetical protein TrVE_jg12370 [Triparma verrucosa]|uniref:Uncharacterized protein n=2 Tax=Triparma TaxID=722752 RepID=A0A9W7C1J4_9STRA|nr:hypothetical protein TrST_g8107 [Triparma strigata]GMI09038.1 hypothetical protein TrVE_jg12370 [Triparma verrucosa]